MDKLSDNWPVLALTTVAIAAIGGVVAQSIVGADPTLLGGIATTAVGALGGVAIPKKGA